MNDTDSVNSEGTDNTSDKFFDLVKQTYLTVDSPF